MGIPGFLLAYAGGLAVAPFLPFLPLFKFLPFLFAAAWWPLRGRRWGEGCLLAFFLTCGLLFYQIQVTPPADPGHVRAFVAERPVTVEGNILSVAARYPDGSVIDLAATRVVANNIAAPVRGRLRLQIETGVPDATPGDRVRFRTILRAPRLFGTPGEFDYPRHLAARGIFVTAFLPQARDLAVFAGRDETTIGRWRNAVDRGIDAAVPPPLAPLVRSLVTGNQGGLSPDQRELLSRGGISHLFSISGLHFGLIALFLYILARLLYCRSETLLLLAPPRRYLPLFLLPLLAIYLLLAGNSLPARRAFLMVAAGALLLLLGRRTPPLKLLASAALLLLLAVPLALFDPSFQLSFAGVLGIMLLVPPWAERLRSLPRSLGWLAGGLLTTAGATLATTPLVLSHFHLLSPAGLLLNLAAVPVVSWLAVPLGLAGALILPWFPAAAALLFRGSALVIEATLELAAHILSLPGLGGWRLYLTPAQTAAAVLLAAGLILVFVPARKKLAAGLLAAGALLLSLPPPAPAGLTVTALSVGQGDAFLLSCRGQHYLIDGGGFPDSRFDVGERLVAPALARLGVRSLEAVILTHDHPDHSLGLLHVLQHFPVWSFWTGSSAGELEPGLREVLETRQIPLRTFAPGWTLIEGPAGSILTVYAPAQRREALNDSSLVLFAAQGRDSVLLTGDLEAAGVSELVQGTPAWIDRATLLKLPHHGSGHSRPELLLARFRPEAAFVSAGPGNPYHFPHPEVIDLLEGQQIPLFRTDQDGTLRFRPGDGGWEVWRWQKGLFR